MTKRKIAIFFLLFIFISIRESYAKNFDGKWEWIYNQKNTEIPYSIFTIELETRGSKISGKYCFITRYGEKIDCADTDEKNIDGCINLKTGIAEVTFYSFFDAKNGKAEIKISGDFIDWKVLKIPSGGDFFGPTKARLQFIKNEN